MPPLRGIYLKMTDEPEDLQLVMGTKDRAQWEQILAKAEELLIMARADVQLQEVIVKKAEERIAEEKEKFK